MTSDATSDTGTEQPTAIPWGAVVAILIFMWISAPFVRAFRRLKSRLTA